MDLLTLTLFRHILSSAGVFRGLGARHEGSYFLIRCLILGTIIIIIIIITIITLLFLLAGVFPGLGARHEGVDYYYYHYY